MLHATTLVKLHMQLLAMNYST